MDVVLNAEHRRRPLRLVVLALPHRRVAGILARAPIRDADNAHPVLRRMQAERAPHPEHLVVLERRQNEHLHPRRAPTGSCPDAPSTSFIASPPSPQATPLI